MRKFLLAILALIVGVIGVWWISAAPPPGLRIAPPYEMGDVPPRLAAVQSETDYIADTVETLAREIPGYDELILQEDQGRAFAMASDGWIWIVDLESGSAERFVDAPLMAAGGRIVPGDDDRICFCSSYLSGQTYPEDERPGLYELRISTKEITTLLLRVPLPPADTQEGVVFVGEDRKPLAISDMNDRNSRAIAFCNDLDISADGQRIYFSEPFSYAGASMGAGAIDEAISLGNNGRLWVLDRDAETAALVAQNFTFIDGVLLEPAGDPKETSVLVAEATRFRVLRLFLNGDRAGEYDVLWENLPAVPDGLDRDAKGRIWLGLIKERSGLLTWAHANPWIKPLMLRIPLSILPIPEATAFMGMNSDASEVLFYTLHDGAQVRDISVVVPGKDHLYLACFNPERPGLHRVPYPPLPE